METNAGNRWNLNVSIANPLPASLTICRANDAYCTGRNVGARAGSFRFDASEHTTLNLFDCVQPADASCPSSPREFTRISNLRLRYVGFDADFSDYGFSGQAFLDTNDYEMVGALVNENGSGGGFSANFPPGFRAQDRLVKWSWWGLSKQKSGTINCPSGTSFRVRVLGIWLDVTGFLC